MLNTGPVSTPMQPGITAFLHDNDQLAVLAGSVSVPVGARVQVGRTDSSSMPSESAFDLSTSTSSTTVMRQRRRRQDRHSPDAWGRRSMQR